jgi:putative membrane protein
MKMRKVRIAIICLAIGGAGTLFASPAHAQSEDESFATEAASGGMAEVKLGQLAQQNAASDVVKEFGKRMETDHSRADEQLRQAASQDNVSIPTEMGKKDQATYERLSKLQGEEFDKAYARDMVVDHENDVMAFKKEASQGQHPQIKKFAAETVPTLEEHLKLARQMEQSVGGAGRSKAPGESTKY